MTSTRPAGLSSLRLSAISRYHATWKGGPVARVGFLLLLAVAAFLAAGKLQAADKGQVNLLRLDTAKVEATTAPEREAEQLKSLTDDRPDTVAVLTTAVGAPLEVVYGFGGATVAPERLVVHLPEKGTADTVTARVEVLISTASPHGGFQTLRADPLKATGKPQEFTFQPVAASWIKLRFTPAGKGTRVAVAEVAVFGRPETPASKYDFDVAPVDAFRLLERLQKTTLKEIKLSADETALYADVKDGRFNKFSFGEAALLASGVTDPAQRRTYRDRLDKLTADAGRAVAGSKTPFEKGERLLKWLHAGPLAKKGYVAGQTDLSTVLDSGKYNCVSSAVLYAVLGRRLGLDVRGIEVPDHAFCIVYAGSEHADVETTTAAGFNPQRDRTALKEFEASTGFVYIPDKDRKNRREVGEAGLAALIYYNHGVSLGKQKRYQEALFAYFRALSLDREFASAVKNVLAELGGWSLELAREGKYEPSLNILNTGLDLAPRDTTLGHNRRVLYGRWAETRMKDGRDDDALTILQEAFKATADNHFVSLQAGLSIRRGEDLIKAGKWEQALALVEPALKKIEAGPRTELRQWRADVFLRWSREERKAGRFPRAIEILDKGQAVEPEDKRFRDASAYVAYEWLKQANTRGEAEGRKVLLEVGKHVKDHPELQQSVLVHVHSVVGKLEKARQYKEAVEAIDRHKEFLTDEAEIQKLHHIVYDGWANSHADKGEWERAVGVYREARKKYAEDKHLRHNAMVTWNKWGLKLIKDKKWDEAIKVFEEALKDVGDEQTLKHNLELARKMKK